MLNTHETIKKMQEAKNLDELDKAHSKGSIQAIKSAAVQEEYKELTKKFKNTITETTSGKGIPATILNTGFIKDKK